ncbi:MAG: HEAT repeat domain-containing protein, partial [Candidatus Solibacter sp.]
STPASRDFICRQLGQIGSTASVPVLTPMLTAPAEADAARFALERIPGAAADRALIDALSKTGDRMRIGIMNSLGHRRAASSVAALRPLASSPDGATARAALEALAEIADPAALEVLGQITTSTRDGARHVAAEAYLKAADNVAGRGNAAAAVPVYRKLYAVTESPAIRAGALHGLIVTDPQAAPLLLEAFRGDDPRLQAIAIRGMARTSARQLTAEWQKLPEGARVRVLGSLAELRESSAGPIYLMAIRDASPAVRIAAMEGLGAAGDASAVPTLAGIAASSDQETERTAARSSLAAMPGAAVDLKVAAELASAEPKLRLELIRAAGARGTVAASPLLLKLARDQDDAVRLEAVRALRETASTAEIAGLATLAVNPVSGGDRAEIARSLAAALRRSDPARMQDVLSAYASAGDPAARASLLLTMGPAGNAQALPVLRSALRQEDAEVKRAAIVALTDWPDGTPLPDLFEVARSAAAPAHQVLALRGVIKLIALDWPARTPREAVRLFADAMALAKQPEEKRAVLAALPRYPVQESLDLARKYQDDSQVAAEAKAAMGRLERSVTR